MKKPRLADREWCVVSNGQIDCHHLWRHLVLMQDTLHELRVLLKVRKGELIVPLPLGKRFFRMVGVPWTCLIGIGN